MERTHDMGNGPGKDKTIMFGIMTDKPLSQAVARGGRARGSKADDMSQIRFFASHVDNETLDFEASRMRTYATK